MLYIKLYYPLIFTMMEDKHGQTAYAMDTHVEVSSEQWRPQQQNPEP